MKKILCGLFFFAAFDFCEGQVSGNVMDYLNNPLNNARITLFNIDTSFFAETRSNISGNYQFNAVPNGNFFIGASHLNGGYVQSAITVAGVSLLNINVPADTARGQWNILVNSPEALGGTNVAALLISGDIFYCHNTRDPFIFNPATNTPFPFVGDNLVQGCVGPGMLDDGKLIFFGGADQDVYGPGTKKVKTFNPVAQTFSPTQPLLKDFRWYPTTSPLLNGKWLIAGGGDENNPVRTNTSEVYDPATNSTILVDTIEIGNEVSPIVPLYNGKILMTHRPPQLFDPNTLQWDLTGDFVQGNRMPNGDHADHELTLLPEGNVVAIGYKSFTPGVYGNMVEIYNPTTGTWSLGANNLPIRSRTKSILLPNKKILVLAGEKENPADPTPVNAYNYTKLAHFYDPYTNTWKQMRDMNYFREYHATGIVVPDGRVIITGGEGQPGNEPPISVIEEFIPPYLLKGIRPEILNLSGTIFFRPDNIVFDINRTNSVSKVIIMSLPMVTHFMNSSANRFVELAFTQTGNQITAPIPMDMLQVPDGYYTLLAMTDDIPAKGRIIKITSGTVVPIALQYFEGKKSTTGNALSWKVNCTSHSLTMVVERSGNLASYESIYSLTADQVRCLQPFDFTDTKTLRGTNYYRLKMIDNDGSVSYSKIVAIENGENEVITIEMYPTIVINNAVLKIASAKDVRIETVITDMTGRVVRRDKHIIVMGNSLINISCESLSNGYYNITCFTDGELLKSIKFLKQ